jgi:hypothetical protein
MFSHNAETPGLKSPYHIHHDGRGIRKKDQGDNE